MAVTNTWDHAASEDVDGSQEPANENAASPGISFELAQLARQYGHRAHTYRESLKRIGTYFRSPFGIVRMSLRSNVITESFDPRGNGHDLWKAVAEESLLECETQNLPLARRFRVEGHDQEAAILSVPIPDESGQPNGAITLVVRSEGPAYVKRCLGELAALVTIINRQPPAAGGGAPTTQQSDAIKRAVVKAADFESLHELAFAMTNSLKNKFGCSQVVLGKIDGSKVRILSISGLDDLYLKSPGIQHVRQAMAECFDAGAMICCQQTDQWSQRQIDTGHLLHQRWRESLGGAPVASIPLCVGEKCIAVLALSRPGDKPFSGSELREIESTVAPFAPAIQLVSRADRGLLRHAWDLSVAGWSWMIMPGSQGRKWLAAAALLLAATFFLGTIHYDVTLSCSVEPNEVRRVSSPYDATIASCLVEVGDHVTAGQLLCRLDPSELLLQIDQAESELEAAQLKMNQSLERGEIQAAAVAGAECRVIDSRLKMARHRLAQTELFAPCDGTLVSGDIVQKIGEVVHMGDPLFELVPDGDWSIELFAPESVVADLKTGLKGDFSSNARPEESLGCVVQSIRPTAQARQGETVYVVEGTIDRNPDWLRSGMQGVAHVRVGKRPIWWIACHRMIDYAHRVFWF